MPSFVKDFRSVNNLIEDDYLTIRTKIESAVEINKTNSGYMQKVYDYKEKINNLVKEDYEKNRKK